MQVPRLPDLKMNLSTLWNMGTWGVGVNMRYIGGFKECEFFSCNVEEGAEPPRFRHVNSYLTADLFVSKTF